MVRRRVNGMVAAAAFSLIALAAAPAFAKEERQKDPGKHLEFLDKKLQLTDEQRGRVDQLLKQYHTRAQSLKEQLESLKQEKHEKIKALLTPEQQGKFEKIHARKKDHGGRRWFKRHKEQE